MANYLYKVNHTGMVYPTIDDAVCAAFEFIRGQVAHSNRLTKPVVTKIPGGYQVVCFDKQGQAYAAAIDVFTPAVTNRVTFTMISPVKRGYVREDEEDEEDTDAENSCDGECDECPNRTKCEDATVEIPAGSLSEMMDFLASAYDENGNPVEQ